MEPFSWSSSGVFSSWFERRNDGFLANSSLRCGSASSSSLVLDSVRGELVEAPVKLERKGMSAERSMEALKNHSEAEKRRRARINTHFETLRSLVPGAKKMDKASLLAEVISHLKDLKRKAREAGEDCVLPKDSDEVKVESEDELEGRPYSIRVSLSCDYKPGLLSDLRHALDALHMIIVRAEIVTLGCRMKNVFVITTCDEDKVEDNEIRRFRAKSICQALRSVINKFSASDELLDTTLSNKRRRVSIFNP
ncbi:Basic helix-loop-helix transcription factor [Parasponia andersonii]|uniref:Basic helix-loop-helix transcription factor n=1 Tax=Parasponia andersonii TaxID=3476 RepID=A0A2P5AFN8_PARAD|nr:Basic helix-loop-helix transcription factor [Parasponia andersonii]